MRKQAWSHCMSRWLEACTRPKAIEVSRTAPKRPMITLGQKQSALKRRTSKSVVRQGITPAPWTIKSASIWICIGLIFCIIRRGQYLAAPTKRRVTQNVTNSTNLVLRERPCNNKKRKLWILIAVSKLQSTRRNIYVHIYIYINISKTFYFCLPTFIYTWIPV